MASSDRRTRKYHGQSPAAPWEWSATTTEAIAAARLRQMFRDYLVRFATPESDIDGAELIFGELLANVVQHAPGPMSFRLEWHEEHPTLVVVDDGAGFAQTPETALEDMDAESGRGLDLVRALGVKTVIGNRPEGGAHVSVVLPVRRSA